MMELSERSAEIDVLTLKEELDRNGAVEKIGGAAYLTSLLDGVPDVGNVEHYARIVKEKSTLRRLIRAGQRIVRDGLAGTKDAEALLGEATGEIFDIAEGRDPEAVSSRSARSSGTTSRSSRTRGAGRGCCRASRPASPSSTG